MLHHPNPDGRAWAMFCNTLAAAWSMPGTRVALSCLVDVQLDAITVEFTA